LIFFIFVAILDYARESDQTAAVEGLFDTVDSRLTELNVNTQQKRHIYGLILKNVKDWQITYVYDYWVKYFSAFDVDEKIPQEILDEAYKAIIVILKDTEIIRTDQLLATPVVKELAQKNQKSAEIISCYKLLEIYTSSGYSEFKAFQSNKANAKFWKDSGINGDELKYKIRLLSLNSLAAANDSLTYTEVAKVLEIEESEVESFVIDATTSDLLDARIDQLNERILIRHASSRKFDKNQWQTLDNKLDKWKENMTNLLKVIQTSKDSHHY